MANPENIIPYQMKPGTTLNPNGRPKSRTRLLIDELKANWIHGMNANDIMVIYEQLLDADQETITKIGNDPKLPLAIRIAVKQLLSPKGWEIIKDMLDRTHWKATQRQETEHSWSISLKEIYQDILSKGDDTKKLKW